MFVDLFFIAIGSLGALLAPINISAVFQAPNLVSRTNSSLIAMWSWSSYKRNALGPN
jgi:hypothetical protein